mmetsp:Transcript_43738/g.110280  ORF Transcript_43738/g.110280 Transcript_43738/m.110280 type:complete len:326 (+) Transcript_43738:1048-2025(+)
MAWLISDSCVRRHECGSMVNGRIIAFTRSMSCTARTRSSATVVPAGMLSVTMCAFTNWSRSRGRPANSCVSCSSGGERGDVGAWWGGARIGASAAMRRSSVNCRATSTLISFRRDTMASDTRLCTADSSAVSFVWSAVAFSRNCTCVADAWPNTSRDAVSWMVRILASAAWASSVRTSCCAVSLWSRWLSATASSMTSAIFPSFISKSAFRVVRRSSKAASNCAVSLPASSSVSSPCACVLAAASKRCRPVRIVWKRAAHWLGLGSSSASDRQWRSCFKATSRSNSASSKTGKHEVVSWTISCFKVASRWRVATTRSAALARFGA